MVKQSDTTIIIPHIFLSKETDYALKECLKSLDETVPEMKKIVAINGTKFEDDFETVKYPNVEFLVMERQGQCAATNAAVAMTNTPWVFVTNNDMIYAPGWFDRLVNNIEDEMCVSPKLIEPRPGAPTFEVQSFGGAGGDFDKQKWLEFANYYPTVGEMRTGFNFPVLIKRELWDLIGGYDINYDPWGASSDTDLETKIMLAGVQPYQNTNCIVYHFSQTSGTFHPDNHWNWAKNYAYYQEKWGFERGGDPEVWIAQNCIDYEKLIYKPEWRGKYGKSI